MPKYTSRLALQFEKVAQRRTPNLLALCLYMFGDWLNSLHLSELAGVFIHRGLDDADKKQGADCFSPQKSSSRPVPSNEDSQVHQGHALEKKSLEINHLKCLSEKYINLPLAPFPCLSAS